MLQCLAFTHIEIRHIISGVKWKLLSYKANNVCAFSSMGEIADANAFELLRIGTEFKRLSRGSVLIHRTRVFPFGFI